MSLKYEVLKFLFKAIGFKKKFIGKSTEDLLNTSRKKNAKVRIHDLKDNDFDINRIEIEGFPVIKMIHKEHKENANLFIIGSGMIHAIGMRAIKTALKFAKETGLDLYVPLYPLCTDYPLYKAYEMIHETYKEMLNHYDAAHISVLGYSSGGNLALGMISYINDNHNDVPMPDHVYALSPGTCLDTEEEWERLVKLDKLDILTPAQYMITAKEIMCHGSTDVPDYMLYLQKGNYENCPKVSFIYGSDETLYGFAPSMEKIMKKYGVDYEMMVGEGMFHCYPLFPYCREAKEGWNMLINMIKKEYTMIN